MRIPLEHLLDLGLVRLRGQGKPLPHAIFMLRFHQNRVPLSLSSLSSPVKTSVMTALCPKSVYIILTSDLLMNL
jgi:hypothetical protein